MKHTKPREIKLTDTLTGKKSIFIPITPGKVTMYSCGPTVYGYIHIGNLRAGLTPDLFHRYLKRAGYEVNFVRNYTDVDDKIINKANAEKTSADVIAKRFTEEVEKDYALAGMKDPTQKPTVSGHMKDIISMIETLVQKKAAYSSNGDVLYSIQAFPTYGKLSHKSVEDIQAGVRIEVDEKKRNPLDFALWKAAKPGEPSWDSPWGKGRPGWHIECSAMSETCLGEQIDIHHGGEDLIFPHHENEIAQSEAANGKPYVKYWLHHAMVMMSKEKMSKSLGNVFGAREFLTRYNGEVARYLLVGSHYRTRIDFSPETLENTLSALGRIYEAKLKASDIAKNKAMLSDQKAEASWGEFAAECEKARLEIDECFANDFNTAGAFGVLFTLIRSFNRLTADARIAGSPGAIIGSQLLIQMIEEEVGEIVGVGIQEPAAMLKDLERIRKSLQNTDHAMTEDEIKSLITQRLDARKNKDFARADSIRKELLDKGVAIKDGPQGTTWEYQ